MTTIDELRQRLEEQYLEPSVEQSPSAPLASDVDDSQTTITIVTDYLSPDEDSLIGPGNVFELDAELIRCAEYNSTTGVIDVRRGVRGTTAAAHVAATSDFRFVTRWTRKTQHDAITDAINALWQPLFVDEEQTATISSAGYLDLPLDTVRITDIRWQSSNGRWESISGELLSQHPFDSARAAVQIEPLPTDEGFCVVKYGRKIVAPSSASDEIVNLPGSWERIVLVDAAAELLAGVDIDAVTQELLTQQMRLEGFEVKSGASISGSLIRYREYLVGQAARALVAAQPKRIRHKSAVWR